MDTTPCLIDLPDLRPKPTRANRGRSLGPATPEGKIRAAHNSAAQGLRARSLTPVAAFGETQAVLDAHLAAYRREHSAPGPYYCCVTRDANSLILLPFLVRTLG